MLQAIFYSWHGMLNGRLKTAPPCMFSYPRGDQVLSHYPGRSSERVISSGMTLKDTSLTNVDLGFKPPCLKWKGKDAMTGNQLQQMQQRKKNLLHGLEFAQNLMMISYGALGYLKKLIEMEIPAYWQQIRRKSGEEYTSLICVASASAD
ncbi:putative nuclear transcription factor Y subunit A-1-like isoform X1 [Capsicum annuum]|nr:putative nuclear transcription factor Y subunit A-1-like isoform X1 [Capsicum annuum]KAF3639028.1 putative nuclear transcription factor Y subunit A-1-like isoform X1 [Capsicum annuum]